MIKTKFDSIKQRSKMLLFLLHYMFKINIFLIEIQKHNLVNQEKKKKLQPQTISRDINENAMYLLTHDQHAFFFLLYCM